MTPFHAENLSALNLARSVVLLCKPEAWSCVDLLLVIVVYMKLHLPYHGGYETSSPIPWWLHLDRNEDPIVCVVYCTLREAADTNKTYLIVSCVVVLVYG